MSMTKKEAEKVIAGLIEKVTEVVTMSQREIIESYEEQGALAISIPITMRGSSDVVNGNVGVSFYTGKHKLEKPLNIEVRQRPLEFNTVPENETSDQKKIRLKKEKESKNMLAKQQATKDLVAERKQKDGESEVEWEKRDKAIDARLKKEDREKKKGITETKKKGAKTKNPDGKTVTNKPSARAQTQPGAAA